MRILIVAARYRPHRGGLETVVEEITRELLQAGHEVMIVTNRYPINLPKRERINDTLVERFIFHLPDVGALKRGRIDLWLAGFFFLPISLIQLYLLIRKYQPDIVNLHYLGDLSFHLWLTQQLQPFPLVVSLHGGDVETVPYESKFKRWLFQTVVRRARQITACSYSVQRQAIQLVPEIAAKIRVIHNGVDVELFDHAARYPYPHPYVAAVGQFARHKGFDLLITAFEQIKNQFPDVDLHIAGDGVEREALHQQGAALGDRIHWLGSVPRTTVASLMRSAAAVVIPSRREPFGIVGLEAMASGRPIIASQVGGLTEALEDAEVHWFQPEDIDKLATMLALVLSTPPQVPSARNRAAASSHSWQAVAQQYLEVYLS